MTCSTTPRDSMKPLTATRSIRFVVALYSVLSTSPVSAGLPSLLVSENDRRTRGLSSASTWRARRAVSARRWSGRGTSIVLCSISAPPCCLYDEMLSSWNSTYSEHGKSLSIDCAIINEVEGTMFTSWGLMTTVCVEIGSCEKNPRASQNTSRSFSLRQGRV